MDLKHVLLSMEKGRGAISVPTLHQQLKTLPQNSVPGICKLPRPWALHCYKFAVSSPGFLATRHSFSPLCSQRACQQKPEDLVFVHCATRPFSCKDGVPTHGELQFICWGPRELVGAQAKALPLSLRCLSTALIL